MPGSASPAVSRCTSATPATTAGEPRWRRLARFGDIVDAAEGAGAEGGDAAGVRGEGETAGDGFERLVDTYVDRWLALVEQQADAWFALIDAESANRDAEVATLVQRARAAMVEGIVTALGLATCPPSCGWCSGATPGWPRW